MQRYCEQCGEKLNNETATFCPKCGTQLESKTEPNDNNRIIIFGLIGIIVVLVVAIGITTGGFGFLNSPAANSEIENTTTSEVNSQVTSTRTEPDYESFSYSNSFEDTDKNGDGYVYLSDMNIAHTPKNIVNQMFADSDDDGDGKLNHHEYYKFMYKLNYDRSSYGM